MANTTVTYDEILEVLNTDYSEFVISERVSDNDCIVVNPPEEFHHDSPVEIWIEHGEVDLFFEDEQVGETQRGLFTAEDVANVSTGLLQIREDRYIYSDE